MAGAASLVLVVDHDPEVLRDLERVLRQAGHEVDAASDGALAMNKAIATPPALVVTAAEMPLLDGFKLCQLLRTNPVTREVPFVFLTTRETTTADLGKYLRPSDEFLLKPFKEEEILARVAAILSRGRVTRPTADDQQKLLGTLTEITLMDLLQVLRMNRRSGLLEVEMEGRRGTLFLSEGEVVDAEVGRFRGEKAFYRTLEWDRGKFEFRPQQVAVRPLIKRPGENLILEGLRQLDEVNKLRGTLAPPGTRLELVRRFEGPPERLKPATREILKLMEYFTSLEDILNQSTFLDLDLCSTLQTLVERKIVAVVSLRSAAEDAVKAQPLLTLEDALKLSYQLGVGREEGQRVWSGKVLIAAESGPLLRRFLEGLSRLKEFRIDASVVLGQQGDAVALGPVGTLQVLEGTELVLFAFPGAAAFSPLWESLSSGAVGGIALVGAFPPFPPFARTSDAVLRLPFLIAGPGLRAPAGGAGDDFAPTVRHAVAGYADGDEASHLAAFRAFFSLILEP
jgi:DNA-binding response OmpR family regulator